MKRTTCILLACAFAGALSSCKSSVDHRVALRTNAWQLKEFTTGDGPVALSSHLPTLYFQDSVYFSGFSGCNRYSGKYELKGKKITFSRIVSTHMMCPEDMEMERQYQQFIPTVARFSLRNNELTLRDETGKARVFFVPILLHNK